MTRGGPGRRSGSVRGGPLRTCHGVSCFVMRRARPPSRCVMFCHVLSCSAYAWGIFRSRFRHIAVHSLTASPACPRPSRAGSPGGGAAFMSCAQTSARAAAGTSLAASFAAGAGRGIGCSHACLLSGKGRDRDVPVSRAFRAGGRAGVGAGAVRAADCARETPDAPRPSVPARAFFRPPAGRFLQKRRKAAPEAASLLSFYTIPPNVKPAREQKMKTP